MENIEPGDFMEVDAYYQELLDEGYDAEVVNITETTTGFLAVVVVNGTDHAVFDALHGKCMVSEIKTKLEYC